MFRRKVRDSHGHWGEITYFSELNIPDCIKEPTPEAIANVFLLRVPDIGFGETNRVNAEDKERLSDYLRVVFTLMTPKQQIVIYRRYYQNKTLVEISKEVGISIQGVASLEKNALITLRRIMLEDEPLKLEKQSNIKGKKRKKRK